VPAVATPPTIPTKIVIICDGWPTFAKDVGSCLQRLGPGLSVAFAGEGSDGKDAGYFPTAPNTDDTPSCFTHIPSVALVVNPTKEVYQLTTPPAKGAPSRLTLAAPFNLGVHLPRPPLSRA
jgi:hypothetical protein